MTVGPASAIPCEVGIEANSVFLRQDGIQPRRGEQFLRAMVKPRTHVGHAAAGFVGGEGIGVMQEGGVVGSTNFCSKRSWKPASPRPASPPATRRTTPCGTATT